jgi:hypothetical protein
MTFSGGQEQQEFGHAVEMLLAQKVVEAHRFANDGQDEDHGGHPGKERADDKVGAKDGAVPARLDGHSKVPGDDGVHGEHDGDDGVAKDVDGGFLGSPFLLGAAPAQSQGFVQLVAPASRVVADHGQVGQQADVGKEDAATQVGKDGRQIP